jgi:hypothetical protein
MKDGKPNLIHYDLREGKYIIPKAMDSGYVELGNNRMEFTRKEAQAASAAVSQTPNAALVNAAATPAGSRRNLRAERAGSLVYAGPAVSTTAKRVRATADFYSTRTSATADGQGAGTGL